MPRSPGPPTNPVRIFTGTHATWRRLALELAPELGRVVTLSDVAAALTQVAGKDRTALLAALKAADQ